MLVLAQIVDANQGFCDISHQSFTVLYLYEYKKDRLSTQLEEKPAAFAVTDWNYIRCRRMLSETHTQSEGMYYLTLYT